MEDKFVQTIVIDYFVAFGVMLGGCLIGGIGAFIVNEPPVNWVEQLSDKLKIWALVAAIGGTFDTITAIERGFFYESPGDIFKQISFICSAYLGAHSGSILIKWLIGGEIT